MVVHSRAERVCIFFASKSFAAVRESFGDAFPDKKAPNKTTVHWLVTRFRDTGSVCLWQVLIERQNSWNNSRTYFKQCISWNKGVRLQEFNIHTVSAACDCLFSIFAATLHIWWPSPPSATRGRAMPWWQGTHLTWLLSRYKYELFGSNAVLLKQRAALIQQQCRRILCCKPNTYPSTDSIERSLLFIDVFVVYITMLSGAQTA
jgi:hypothetical protein